PSGSGTRSNPCARRWRRNAWIVGVHGPAVRRTVFPTRTTAVMFPPARISSRSAISAEPTHWNEKSRPVGGSYSCYRQSAPRALARLSRLARSRSPQGQQFVEREQAPLLPLADVG